MTTQERFARRLTGKVAFVTGAGAGIGRATALAFAAEGASVAVAGIPGTDVAQTARLIEEGGGRALALTCDVTREDEVRAALGRTVEASGGWTWRSTTPASSSVELPRRTSPPRNGPASSTPTSPGSSSA